MSMEEKLDKFIQKYEADQKEELRRSNCDKYENLMYIAWGFTLATVSLASTSGTNDSVRWVSVGATIFFFLVGWLYYFFYVKWRKKKKS